MRQLYLVASHTLIGQTLQGLIICLFIAEFFSVTQVDEDKDH